MVYRLSGVVEEWRLKGNLGSLEVETLDITNINGNVYYHCRGIARSSMLVSSRYKLHDVYESWINTNDFKSIRIRKQIQEGKYKDNVRVEINPTTFEAVQWDKKNPNGKKILVPSDGYDIFGLLCYIRSKRPKSEFSVVLYDGDFRRHFRLFVKDGGVQKVRPLFRKGKRKFHLLTLTEKDVFGLSVNVVSDGNFVPVSINASGRIGEQQPAGVRPAFTLKTGNVHLSGKVKLIRYKVGH